MQWRATFDFGDSQDPFGSQDPFAFDDDIGEQVSKWDLLSGKKNLSQSQKSSSVFEEDEYGSKDIVFLSQQESCNMERHDSPPQASCLHVVDDAKLNLLADCLLASVKVLMNLTNDNSVGCRQIAVCGGLETLCGLIAGHYPSFSSYLPNFSDQAGELIVLEGHNKCLNDQELDFLIAILVLLVNLVEKDSRNRTTRIPIVREKNDCDAYSELLLGILYLRKSLRNVVSSDSVHVFLSSLISCIKRDTPLMGIHKVPSYIPTYELVAGHQIVYFEMTLVDSLKELGKAVVREMLFMCFTKAIIWDLASWRNIHFMLQVTLVDSLKELGKGFLLTDAWGYGTGTTSLYQSHPHSSQWRGIGDSC
ncbi:putative wings apart-like protein regulation of heterochromatin protein [Tanacetum coccineum]